MKRISTGLALSCLLALVGCGGESTDSTSSQKAGSVSARTQSTTPTATTGTTQATRAPDVRAAEDAARDELPDAPIWQGTRFEGTVVDDRTVCVDRILTKSAAQTVGGNRTSHVVVSWPDLEVGEPQDGPCKKAEQNADKAEGHARRFYLRMDEYAIALDEAISDAQNGTPGAAARIARLRTRIRDRLNDHLLDGGDTSVGANLLLSAATTALDAANSGDVAELAEQRREVATARTTLAEELAN